MKKIASALSPETDVVVEGSGFIATSTEPWLGIAAHLTPPPGNLVELVYCSSYWDEPVRPVFRFWVSDGTCHDKIAPGPVAGMAVWTCRIPTATIRISVSPTNRRGRFDFELVSVRTVSFGTLLARGICRQPRAARSTVLTRLIGWTSESDVNLDWATGSTPLEAYAAWRKARSRKVELASLDEPRSDWASGPAIYLFVDPRQGRPELVGRTISALKAQIYPRWILFLLTDDESGEGTGDPRVRRLPKAKAAAVLRSLSAGSLVAVMSPGDRLYSIALGIVAESAARLPQARVFYGDEDFADKDDKLVPVFKPAWSPLLEAGRPFLGRAVFLDGEILASWSDEECNAYVTRAEVPAAAVARFLAGTVQCLRRILLTRGSPWAQPKTLELPAAPAIARLVGNPSALIVIPTRDRALLLSRCIESIFTRTEYENFSVVIVDNDSIEPATRRLFAAFRGDKAITILRSPGPFNFSALCNAGAARRKADVLVFLNNDTEVLSEGWLGRLVETALLPDVGAVGGLLLYPDHRIQHAGVVLGMGNGAGHFGARSMEGTPGWLGRNEVAHEVSAVTGACLAVERQKFLQVRGFDAEHLPVEQSDIDFCLRLAERGWIARYDPEVRLIHAESASRGTATFRRLEVYDEQRRWLRRRWLGALRDDPFFHPGLSLYSLEPALS